MVLFYLIFPSVYQLRIMIFTAWQTITVKCVQERIRIKFLYGIYTWSDPFSSQHHQCSAHCRNTCCITDCLASNLMVAFLMIAYVIDIVSLLFSIFYTGKKYSRYLFFLLCVDQDLPDPEEVLSGTGSERFPVHCTGSVL